jgi:putative hemolysin
LVGIAVALGLAIVFSAFFTAAELAVFTPSEARIRALSDEGKRGAPALVQLRARPERVLVLLRLLDGLADVTAGALTGYLAFLHWDLVGLVLAIAVVSILILYFGELLPIGIAVNHAQPFALALAPSLLVLTRTLSPLIVVLSRLARVRTDRRASQQTPITQMEIRHLTALGHVEGEIEEHERELIERAFRLDETRVWDIMTPRVDIYAWEDSLPLKDIASELGTVRFSRIPVYGETIDDVTGVLYVRDAYKALVSGQRDVLLKELAREPLVVPGSVPLSQLLRDFQARRIHLAIVVDEYGGTDGLVTLEDVIEELVGEIVDETDVAEEPITRVSRSEIIAVGDVDLREINHYFNVSLPLLEHRSLNGYLLEELGRVPEVGETLERDGIGIEVLEASDTQVTRARIRRAAVPPEGSGDGAAMARRHNPETAESEAERSAFEEPEASVRAPAE